MKYLVWVIVFAAYLLMFAGIFVLINNTTKDVEVEVQYYREVRGNMVLRTEMAKFNELPAVRMTLGMLGLLISMGVPYAAANVQSKAWGAEGDIKMSKKERLIWAGVFAVFFFAFSFMLDVHTIFDILHVKGFIFMAFTCAGSYVVSTIVCKLYASRQKANNEVG